MYLTIFAGFAIKGISQTIQKRKLTKLQNFFPLDKIVQMIKLPKIVQKDEM